MNHQAAPVYARFKMAIFWQTKGKFAQAMAGYQDILRDHPQYMPAIIELGNLLQKEKRLEEAKNLYRQTMALYPDDPFLKQGLADVTAGQDVVQRQAAPQDGEPYRRPPGSASHNLLYTDRPDIYGAEQIGHMLMMDMLARGKFVTCAQPFAGNHLVGERQRAGIQHLWLEAGENQERAKLSDTDIDYAEPERIFALTQPDLIIFNDGDPLSNLAAKEAAARLEIPFLIITHLVTGSWASRYAANLHRLPAMYRQALEVVAVSRENLDLLRQYFNLPQEKGRVILNGRPDIFFSPRDDADRRSLRRSLGIPDTAVVVLTTARLDLVKGYQYQLQAIETLCRRPIWPNLYFLWAGVGTLASQLLAFVADHKIENQVKLLGERTDMPQLLDAADIFLLPSKYEGMPLSILEAMAKGLPVAAAAVSGIPQALGDTGKLLPDPHNDPLETVAGIIAILEEWAGDPALRHAAAKSCQQRAVDRFTAAKMLAGYWDIIDNIERTGAD